VIGLPARKSSLVAIIPSKSVSSGAGKSVADRSWIDVNLFRLHLSRRFSIEHAP